MLKSLTKTDVIEDDSWTQATIVVISNEERCRINEQQSKALSKRKNCQEFKKKNFMEQADRLNCGKQSHFRGHQLCRCSWCPTTQLHAIHRCFCQRFNTYIIQDNINPNRGYLTVHL